MFTYQGLDGWELHAAVLGEGPHVVLMHGGGPDHRSLLPLGKRLAARYTVVLPDVRGYGRSVCADPAKHTWAGYADDVAALLDHLDVQTAVVGGTGIGSSIALSTCLRHPDRVRAAVLISAEDIEDDESKAAEAEFMDDFARRARAEGVEAAWAPILPALAPLIGALVADAIPRSDPESIAAAAAIGRDRLVRSAAELAAIVQPTLVIPGIDQRHPVAVAKAMVAAMPHAVLAEAAMSTELRTAEDLGAAFAPPIAEFLARHAQPGG